MHFKERPEDFVVKEVMQLAFDEQGEYGYFLLRKKGWAGFEVLEQLGRATGLKLRDFGFAGLKDKYAVTEQHLSVPRPAVGRMKKVKIRDVTLEFLGYGKERIVLGMLEGNRFMIIVRSADEKRELGVSRIKNYFDQQRFGSKTIAIGRALVQHDFERACLLMGLSVEGHNYIEALRRQHRRILRFYVSSYQSWMWNSVVEKLPDGVDNIPLLGYLTEFTDKRVGKLYNDLMKKEKITLENFLMKPFPELSSEGNERVVFFTVKDFSYRWEWDDLHAGKYKCILQFFLPKGCYATLVVKTLFPGVKDKSA